ncbi:hypothetical protein FHG87_006198, partial [Trinorchestia longiramus]
PKNFPAPASTNASVPVSTATPTLASSSINIDISEEAGDDEVFNEALVAEIIQKTEESYKRSPPELRAASLHPQRTYSEDDDNRSMRSYRSSRMSSRRQSTEDSIDSDDEWYRYEIRKLELQETNQWKDIDPADCYPLNPDETVRRRMTVVLCELQGKIPRAPANDELAANVPARDVQKSVQRISSGSSESLLSGGDAKATPTISPVHMQ